MARQLDALLSKLQPSEHSARDRRLNTLFFLQRVTAEAVDNPSISSDMKTEFYLFYTKVLYLLNRFYPIRTYRRGKLAGKKQPLS